MALLDDQTIAGQMGKYTDTSSATNQRTMKQGAMGAQSRGLGNSSIAVGASQGALLDRAASMAQFDANVYKENFQQDKSIASQEKLQNNEMTLQRDLQQNQLNSTANESLLERQNRLAMQDSDQTFTSGETALERQNRIDMQNSDQDFTSGETALERQNRIDMQNSDQDFIAGESDLERQNRLAMQDSEQTFIAGESNLERIARADLADQEGLLQQALQQNQLASNEAENALDRETQLELQLEGAKLQRELQKIQIDADTLATADAEEFQAAQNELDRVLNSTTHTLSIETQIAIEDARLLASNQQAHQGLVTDALSQYGDAINNIDPSVSTAVYEAYVAQATSVLDTRLAFLGIAEGSIDLSATATGGGVITTTIDASAANAAADADAAAATAADAAAAAASAAAQERADAIAQSNGNPSTPDVLAGPAVGTPDRRAPSGPRRR